MIQFLRTSTCSEAQPLFGINLKDVQEFSGEAKNFIIFYNLMLKCPLIH